MPSRKFCGWSHTLLARAEAGPRTAREVFCDGDDCGISLGLQRPSWIAGARRHYCQSCLPLAQSKAGRRRAVLIGECSHPVAKTRHRLCRTCYLSSSRGAYDTAEKARIASELDSAGDQKLSRAELARRAGVGRSTVVDFFLRKPKSRTSLLPSACGSERGTPAGYQRHRDAGERECGECRKAHQDLTRLHHATRRVGLSWDWSGAKARGVSWRSYVADVEAAVDRKRRNRLSRRAS